ncbi:Hypothetical protein R9X50_00784900 [Acrodontium crateriforme]|uniref:Arrestin-like N-terminal domain-containing protein n=1 Tax=Acrodontium crateriforme TaxID=150365 RepID=A0AAQ3ME68_9PEZI|nr:Hypothetical protein R9X50_00784900 [Acrodontium crateriforme]
MYRDSFSSTEDPENMPSKLRNLVGSHKLDIKIHLNSKKQTYTTLDKIDGHVTLTPAVDTSYDSVDIEFVGTSRTFVERLTTAAAVSGRAEAFHQFLKLTQPNLHRYGPEDGILKAGQNYQFPFVFVVPQQLLLRICQHRVHSPLIRDAHLQLPPSFGDRDNSGRPEGLDDISPEMTSIRYGVFAKVSKVKMSSSDEPSIVSLGSKARKVRIIPATEELPPLDVKEEDGEYLLRKEKAVRKGMLKGKLGTLVMEAAQPSSIRLKHHNNPDFRASTMATIMLRFDPNDETCAPPKLGSLANKIRVHTFFGSSARQNFPSKNGALLDLSQGMHCETIALSSRCMANVEWQKCDPSKPETLQRRDSACSLTPATIPAPTATYKDGIYYTARLLVPINLPENKAFVPTFHSCLISRIYTLKLDLSLPAGMGGNMDLKVPVQVSSQGNDGDASPGRRESISSDLEQDIGSGDSHDSSQFFEPRMLRVPSATFIGRSNIGSSLPSTPLDSPPIGDDLPPGYTPYAAPGPDNRGRRTSYGFY